MLNLQQVTTDELAAAFLGVALLAGIFAGLNELATTIASGLVGFMGRAAIKGRK